MTKIVSNAQLFAKRGDQWVTERDRRRMFGPPSLSEDPDMDQWTRAGFARPKPVNTVAGVVVTKAKKIGPGADDPGRRRVNKLLRLKKMIERPINEVVDHDRAIARAEALRIERKS